METCGLLILAGGKSQRMFFPKPYLQYQGKPFFEHIATVYKSTNISKSCLVIIRDITTHEWESYYKKALSLFSVVKKIDTHQGRFHSVKTGINALSEMDYCFIHNIDNPFIDMETINFMWQHRNKSGYTVPVFQEKKGHPVLISKPLIKRILELTHRDYNLKELLKEFSEQFVSATHKGVLLNINTPDDYRKFIQKYETNELV